MRHFIFSVPIDDVSNSELDVQLKDWVNGNVQKFITTPNPEFLLLSEQDAEFKLILQKSDLSLPDGVGLRFAVAALSDQNLAHRQTGVELVERLIKVAHETSKRVLLLGGEDQSAEKTKQRFEQKFPGVQISLFNPGKINLTDLQSAISSIRDFAPDVLLVALGQGKQERFIQAILPNVPSIRIAVGIGGAFEMISNMKPRAPLFMRRAGLEWLWRVFIEPRRIKRILNASIVFPIMVIWSTLKQNRFLKACRRVVPEIYRQLKGL